MSDTDTAAAAEERTREQASGVIDRTYFDIVADQFKRNRLAVVGLRVIVALILVAVFAPFLANSRPIVFNGYRYKSYLEAYDQLVYAHGDLFGVGRDGEKLQIPGLEGSDDANLAPEDRGLSLPGLGTVYQNEIKDWDAGTQTWKQVRNVSFGEAEPLMNRLRVRLEEEIPSLEKDNLWKRGYRKISYLRTRGIPKDIEADLDDLLVLARKNLDEGYRAKAALRQRSLLQQFKTLQAEVSAEDREAIREFAARYKAAVVGDFHMRPPAELAEYDDFLIEVRTRLAPSEGVGLPGVNFESHWDFPAIRQLEALEILFLVFVILAGSVRLWGRLIHCERPQDELIRKVIVIAILPFLVAGAWAVLVPRYSDTTDYQAGMVNGDLRTNFRVMAPLRYGVNDNNPSKKWTPPWWFGDKEEKNSY